MTCVTVVTPAWLPMLARDCPLLQWCTACYSRLYLVDSTSFSSPSDLQEQSVHTSRLFSFLLSVTLLPSLYPALLRSAFLHRSEPLVTPSPFYDLAADRISCYVIPKYGMTPSTYLPFIHFSCIHSTAVMYFRYFRCTFDKVRNPRHQHLPRLV